MQLVIVRHGQSANNASYAAAVAKMAESAADDPGDARIAEEIVGYPERVPDPALTELGTRQAQALGKALTSERPPFTPMYLYASPTARAVATARPLSAATGLPILLQPDAYEVGGIQDVDERTGNRVARPGATLAELQRLGGNVLAPPGLFPNGGRPWAGGFEADLEGVLPRARRVLNALLLTHRTDDVVALVCHQFFAQFLLAAALRMESPPWRRFRVDNTGHASLRMENGEALTEWLNRVDHLEPSEITN